MKVSGLGKIVRIYIEEERHWHGRELYKAIVERARSEGIAGATVLHGIEGYGSDRQIHEWTFLGYYTCLPVCIEIVDCAERIGCFLPLLDEMLTSGVVTIQDCEVVTYLPAPPGGGEVSS